MIQPMTDADQILFCKSCGRRLRHKTFVDHFDGHSGESIYDIRYYCQRVWQNWFYPRIYHTDFKSRDWMWNECMRSLLQVERNK